MVLLFVVCGWREEAVAGVFLRTYLVHSTYVFFCTRATISFFIMTPTTVHSEYEFRQPFGRNVSICFRKMTISIDVSKAPLSPQVYGIGGQTNTLSDPPLHVDHGDTIY
jgi:hypothetical protein